MADQNDRIRRAAEALQSLSGAAEPIRLEADRRGPPQAPPGEAESTSRPGQRPGRPVRLPRRLAEPSGISLRRTAIPVLLTTGLGMLLLGGWAICVLAFGFDPIRPELAEQNQPLARLMLLAWPTGLILLAGAGIFMRDVVRWYKRADRR